MLKLDTIWTRRKEMAKQRLEICSTCDKFNKDDTRCNECGCFMLVKTILPFSDCPLNKWRPYNEEKEND